VRPSVRRSCEHVFVSKRPSYDWALIRTHYEAGHAREECQLRFGFSNGAWNRAVERGDIEPRPRFSGQRASAKRLRIGELHRQGLSYSEIARTLALSKSTVAYHAHRLGIPADDRASRRYDWTAIQEAYDSASRSGSVRSDSVSVWRAGLRPLGEVRLSPGPPSCPSHKFSWLAGLGPIAPV
jgi:hypothetical protein